MMRTNPCGGKRFLKFPITLVDSKESFKKQLSLLQARIDAYNSVELQEQCKNAEERAIKLNEIWSKMFGLN